MTKIIFEIVLADGFTFPPDDGRTNLHLWPIPTGKSFSENIEIEFEPAGGDELLEAEAALKEHIKKHYPNKDYKIYYWWWK